MPRPKRHPGGRPPVTGETRSERIGLVAVTADEKREVERLAKAAGVSVSEWIRRRATTTGAERGEAK